MAGIQHTPQVSLADAATVDGGTACAATLGVGAIPSRVPTDKDLGHMWLYWADKIDNQNRTHRGYYPLANKIPEEYRGRLRDYFFDHACPGARFRDLSAARYEETCAGHCKDMSWQISDTQHWQINRRCWIPPGENMVEEGLYSFDTTRPGWNNCASWAIQRVNETLESDVLPMPRPARIKHVIPAIWGEP